ncbi:MAG: GntR family transcriptional regulator [Burkholderiaceae bacterium]
MDPGEQKTAISTWQAIHTELRRRLSERIWAPGDYLPSETQLAAEFSCARATVNRAMRELADSGLIDRRRKAGTRVVKNPVRRATFDIPIIREEIERRGARWSHQILSRQLTRPPPTIAGTLGLSRSVSALHLRSLYYADRNPFVYEDRWINPIAVPTIANVDLAQVSANEWLVQHAPFTHGEYTLSAAKADAPLAELLNAATGDALLVVDRITFNEALAITSVRLTYAPGYRVVTTL